MALLWDIIANNYLVPKRVDESAKVPRFPWVPVKNGKTIS